jgi:DNA-directed RNA polymerase sigma subunit (sigma70/sigma32)
MTLTQVEARLDVLRGLAAIRPRSASVLRMRYGVDVGPGLVQREVARELGVSTERARQLEIKALREMRKALGASE